eukprot:9023095-Pyramimonas_sp.AAC.1
MIPKHHTDSHPKHRCISFLDIGRLRSSQDTILSRISGQRIEPEHHSESHFWISEVRNRAKTQ